MIYQLLRIPLVALFFLFYRRIYFTGKENIPQKAPTLIASNHSTAFMEQILVGGLQTRSVFYWARGSVFEEKWSFPKLFRQAHVIPIWRPQEGLKKMQQNKQIFEDSKNILLEGKMFFISPEGNSVPEKRLRTFKTGTARLALFTAAANNFEEDVFILPTGVNYTYHCDFRSEVMIHCGPPINVKDYQELYEKDKITAAKILTQDLKKAIANEVVIINNKADEPLVEQLHLIMRNENKHFNDAIYSKNVDRVRLEQQVANTCNQLSTNSKSQLQQATDHYFEMLSKHQLNDQAVKQQGKQNLGLLIKTIGTTPLALLGWIGGIIPVKAARYLRNTNVDDLQFWAPMAVVFSLLTWTIYSIIIAIVGGFFIGWSTLLFPVFLVLLQHIAFTNPEAWTTILANWKYNRWEQQHPDLAISLTENRKALITNYLQLAIG